jgi:hypothetical protein
MLTSYRHDAPRITLKMGAAQSRPELSTALPYYINFTLQRLPNAQEKPCIFRWDAHSNGFSRSRFVLLRRTANDDLEKVDVTELPRVTPDFGEEDTMSVDGYNHHLWDLKAGGNVSLRAALPMNYQKLLVPGEKCHLIWPGGEIDMWDWGTIREHIGEKLKSQSTRDSKLPRLVLPACDGIAFTAKEESEPWPDRPERESKAGFAKANLEEQQWRMARERDRGVSPPGIQPSERV